MKAVDKFLLEINTPLVDEIVTESGFKFYLDPSYKPEWNACGWGKVKYAPKSFPNVKENDEVAISYHVIANRTYPDTDENFHAVTEGSPYYEKFRNAKGWWITKAALQIPNTNGVKWAAFLQDDRMDVIDGAEGTQSEVERWMAQFSFGGDDRFSYKNLIEHDGNKFWKADDFNIFAKIEDGEIIALSDRVICRPLQVDKTAAYNIQNQTILPPWTVVGMFLDRATVISGGENIGLKKGDIVGFEQRFCEKYTLWGTECFLIKEDRIDLIYQSDLSSQSKNIYHVN